MGEGMKKLISVFLALALLISVLSGCSQNYVKSNSSRISVVATIFPQYDWIKNVIGDCENIEITLLVKNGVDLHSYQPSVVDIAEISTCDLFIYVGGESDNWVPDVLSEAVNKDMVAINLLELLGDNVKEEEEVEGMQEDIHQDEAEEDEELDEHVWLSLKNAQLFTELFANTLSELDSANSDKYQKNSKKYISLLSELDEKYANMVENSSKNVALFADRFPFRYLFDDYNLSYYAAFKGCSAETEASFETITFLADKLSELELDTVLILENSDTRIAQSVITASGNSDCQIQSLDSIQSVTSQQIENGLSYISLMENNLDVLKTALS